MKKLILCLWLASWAPAVSGQEIVTLATRPRVTQSFFLAKVPPNPQAAALLFPGATINLRRENDEIKYAPNNFLARAGGEFISRGVIAALIDTPTETQSGAAREQEFRLGAAHVADVAVVVRDLKRRFPGVPIFLIGSSMGTLSAAATGAHLGNEIHGVVLTSTLLRPAPRNAPRPGPGLSRFDFAAIKAPLLFVHHVSDQCAAPPYGDAARFAERYALITVFGGAAPQSGPCEVFSQHNFYGKDGETVEQIVNWMLKKPFQSEVK